MNSSEVLRRLAGAGAAVAATAALLTGAVAPAQAVPADVAEGTVLAVTGSNRSLYVRTDAQSAWTNLGGALASAPAVASYDGVTHYIATGTNKVLYHRTNTTGWTRLANAYCTDVSATADAETVWFSCRGSNGALYAGQFPVTAQKPALGSLTKLGGVVQGAVPVTLTDAGPQFFARGGTYYDEEGYAGNTWTWDAEFGWERYWVLCDGTPAVASSQSVLFFACQSGASVIAGEAWHPGEGGEYEFSFFEVAGEAIGTPALAMVSEDRAQLFVQGSDQVVYHRTLAITGATGPRWSKISSVVLGGVGAATRWSSAG